MLVKICKTWCEQEWCMHFIPGLLTPSPAHLEDRLSRWTDQPWRIHSKTWWAYTFQKAVLSTANQRYTKGVSSQDIHLPTLLHPQSHQHVWGFALTVWVPFPGTLGAQKTVGSGLPPDAAFLWARGTAPDSVHTGNSDTILMTGLTTDLDAREDRLETPREKKTCGIDA